VPKLQYNFRWQLVVDEKPSTFGMSPVQILFMTRKRFRSHLYQWHDGPAEGRHGDSRQHPSERRPLQLLMGYREAVSICMRTDFHIADFPAISQHRFRCRQVTIPKFQPARFL